jgi:hypothetical protein
MAETVTCKKSFAAGKSRELGFSLPCHHFCHHSFLSLAFFVPRWRRRSRCLASARWWTTCTTCWLPTSRRCPPQTRYVYVREKERQEGGWEKCKRERVLSRTHAPTPPHPPQVKHDDLKEAASIFSSELQRGKEFLADLKEGQQEQLKQNAVSMGEELMAITQSFSQVRSAAAESFFGGLSVGRGREGETPAPSAPCF